MAVTIASQLGSIFGGNSHLDEMDDSPKFETILCKTSELKNGEKREFDVSGQPIVVVNDGGQFRALYGRCTHYKGKLANGSLVNGKLRCPLHGACFDVATGDIEDGPGFDCLQTFETAVDDNGNLILRGSEMQLKRDRRRRPMIHVTPTSGEAPLVIVGAGPAGLACAETLRHLKYAGPITMISDDRHPPYDRVKLSKAENPKIDDITWRTHDFMAENAIALRLETEVTSICHKTKTLIIKGNHQPLHYSKLVLATGGRPRQLDVDGGKLNGVFYLRKFDDAAAIHANVEGKQVVIIGTSFIGLELAGSIAKKASSVTLIGTAIEPLAAVFGEDVGRGIRKFYEKKNVRIVNQAKIQALLGDASGHVTAVQLADEKVTAEMVIVGIGVNPATDFLRDTGVALDHRGFVRVNDRFETNVDDIYAIGDIVLFPLPLLGIDATNVQHWQLAQRQGAVLGSIIANCDDRRGVVPFFWTNLFGEKGFRFAGCADGHDDVVTKGDGENLQFVRYYLRGDRVIAVANSGMQQQAIQFLDLFAYGIHVNKADVIRNVNDDWTSLLQSIKT